MWALLKCLVLVKHWRSLSDPQLSAIRGRALLIRCNFWTVTWPFNLISSEAVVTDDPTVICVCVRLSIGSSVISLKVRLNPAVL